MLKQPAPALGSGRPWFAQQILENPSRRSISRDEQEEIKYAFSTLDTGNTGYVTPRQLKASCSLFTMVDDLPVMITHLL